MRREPIRAFVSTVWRSHASSSRLRDEHGFTLIELLIVCAITPIIIGGLAVALIELLSLQQGAQNRISDAADAQTVSSYYEKDVLSAEQITTSATAAQCGSGTQLLGLEWNLNLQNGQYQTVISYVVVGVGQNLSLVRQSCTSGASATPTSSTTVSSDVPSSQQPPTISSVSGYTGSPSTGWATTVGVMEVKFSITEPASQYSYTLDAAPAAGSSSGSLSGVGAPASMTGCGFATPDTGTYTSTLCFVDFTPFNYATYNVDPNPANSPLVTPPSSCQQMSADVANTPYVLSFCLSTTSSAGAVVPYIIPTYFDPGTSESYLGNNGVYTGIPGDPALYQNSEGATSYVYISNIKLLDSNGNAATSWELVTGDAESTDQGESITWTSNQPLNLLPDSPTSAYGNACAGSSPPAGLTGVGTTTVTCGASVGSDKTGTVMLEAAEPTTLTVTLVGTGLEAIFVGVLLP
jgi:competence protein ComGC